MFFMLLPPPLKRPVHGCLRKRMVVVVAVLQNSVAGGRKIQTGTKIIKFHLLPYAHCFRNFACSFFLIQVATEHASAIKRHGKITFLVHCNQSTISLLGIQFLMDNIIGSSPTG